MSQLIHKQMIAVMRKISPIEKNQKNDFHKYKFRGIDDVFNALNGPLSEVGIFYVPEVLEKKEESFKNEKGNINFKVSLRVKYTFYAEDGSSVSSTVEGEAIDQSDKATNKALQAALKYMLLQVFCVPTHDMDDADAQSPQVSAPKTSAQVVPLNQPPPVVVKSNGEKPKCQFCQGDMMLSKAGNGYYCPNFRDNKGEHSRFRKEDLEKYLNEQKAQSTPSFANEEEIPF